MPRSERVGALGGTGARPPIPGRPAPAVPFAFSVSFRITPALRSARNLISQARRSGSGFNGPLCESLGLVGQLTGGANMPRTSHPKSSPRHPY